MSVLCPIATFNYFSAIETGRFLPMNSNRAINSEVISDRVRANLEEYEKNGKYCEFGQINLLIIESEPTMTFLIMDGQVN